MLADRTDWDYHEDYHDEGVGSWLLHRQDPQPSPWLLANKTFQNITVSEARVQLWLSFHRFSEPFDRLDALTADLGFADAHGAELRARTDLTRLISENKISAAVFLRSLELVSSIFNQATVYASISHEGLGAIFYWTAGPSSVQIDIEPDGSYWWSVEDVNTETYDGEGRDLPVDMLKYSLNQFSKEVERQNPNWRSQVDLP